MNKKISLCIAGDLVPTKPNYFVFETGSMNDLLGEKLAAIWNCADFRIANLEAPIIDAGIPILKSGPPLCIPEKAARGLKTLNLSMVGLSNNHIRDYGTVGIENTEKILQELGIDYIGVGSNSRNANQGKIYEMQGIKIGFYACSEHEFSAAGPKQAGANAIGVDTALRIHEIKEACDYEVVLFHGGKEHYPYPTPMQQERCRSFIDAGADVVICQHSHCVGCEEIYNSGTIIYGQGNFIFDYKDEECWKTGLIIEIILRAENTVMAEVIFHPIYKKEHTVAYVDEQMSKQIIKYFQKRSGEICNLEEKYMETVSQDGIFNLRLLAGWSRVKRGMDRFLFKDKLIRSLYSNAELVNCMGILNCETNREITVDYLGKMAEEP